MPFLPEDYKKIPTNSDYMKFKDGESIFRILSSAVVGYEYWNTENKPVRAKERWDGIPADCKPEKDGSYKLNHFWAFVVWNYEEKRIQILEVTQKKVMTQLKSLVDSARWGDPKMYDITVMKSGTGFDTEYVVQGNPPLGEPDAKILEAFAKKNIRLEALFDGTDPFGKADTASPAAVVAKVEEGYAPIEKKVMSDEEAAEFLAS